MEENLTIAINKVDLKVDKVEESLTQAINKVDLKIDKVEESLKSDIKVLREEVQILGNKFNNIAWIGLFGIVAILSKEYVIAFFTKG